MCWIHQICRDAHHLTLSSCCKISPLDSWRGEPTHQTTLPRHIWSLAAHNRSHWNTPIGVVKKQPRHLVSWGRNFLTTTADVGQNIGITNLYLHNVNKVDFKSTDNDNSVHWSKLQSSNKPGYLTNTVHRWTMVDLHSLLYDSLTETAPFLLRKTDNNHMPRIMANTAKCPVHLQRPSFMPP